MSVSVLTVSLKEETSLIFYLIGLARGGIIYFFFGKYKIDINK